MIVVAVLTLLVPLVAVPASGCCACDRLTSAAENAPTGKETVNMQTDAVRKQVHAALEREAASTFIAIQSDRERGRHITLAGEWPTSRPSTRAAARRRGAWRAQRGRPPARRPRRAARRRRGRDSAARLLLQQPELRGCT